MPTPYALKSQTNFVSFMYFLLNSTTDNISEFLLRSSHEEIVEKVLGHTTSVLFTHCTKKKARLEEV